MLLAWRHRPVARSLIVLMHCAPVDGPGVCCVGSSRALTGSAARLYARQLRDAKEPESVALWHCTALVVRATKWQARRPESAPRSARRREDTAWTPLLR